MSMRRRREGALSELLLALGVRLRDVRLKEGFTQEQVSQKLSVSPQAVRNWEAGRHEPTIIHLYRLAELYGVEIIELQQPLIQDTPMNPLNRAGVPINGYLLAGSMQHDRAEDFRTLPLPEFILKLHPNAYGLVIAGDSLKVNGVGDGDIVLVDPDQLLEEEGVHIFQVGKETFARKVEIINGSIRLTGVSLGEEELSVDAVVHMGKIVWHLRQM